MTVIVLALSSALVYGASDFCGGAASRRSASLAVLMISLPVGLLILTPFAVTAGGPWSAHSLVWGAASGVAGGIGLMVFYRALAVGPMSVVAPVSGLVAAVIPVLAGTLLGGERLGAAVLVGIVLCLFAVAFVSMERTTKRQATSGRPRRVLTEGPALAVIAGAGFGTFFVLLRAAGDSTALWPLVTSKAAGLALVFAFVLVRGRPLPYVRLEDRATLAITACCGALDVTANALYLFAAHAGMLSVAGVLSSLYPASTVLLARVVYGERLRPIQRVGLALAVAGVALVTAG